MPIKTLLVSLVLLAALALPPVADADLKVVQSTTIDWSHALLMGKPVTGDMASMMKANPMTNGSATSTTVSMSGNLIRTDTPLISMVIDTKAKTETMLFPATKTYYVMPLPGSTGDKGAGSLDAMTKGMKITQTDGKKTMTMLGHVVHLYLMTISMPAMKMNMKSSMWIAEDLPSMPNYSMGGGSSSSAAAVAASKVKGLPLKMSMKMSMLGMIENMGLTTQVVSLSTAPISPDVFTVPGDWTKTDKMPTAGLSPGGPPASATSAPAAPAQ